MKSPSRRKSVPRKSTKPAPPRREEKRSISYEEFAAISGIKPLSDEEVAYRRAQEIVRRKEREALKAMGHIVEDDLEIPSFLRRLAN